MVMICGIFVLIRVLGSVSVEGEVVISSKTTTGDLYSSMFCVIFFCLFVFI